ncbi:MAG: SigB/SigF/SigG family RNA polymerase sigma factor [Candidatus Dormibacteria bacterium]
MSATDAVPRSTTEAQLELFRRFQQSGDAAARQQLVDAYSNLVYFLARKFAGRGEPLEDLVQVGYVGLLMAIERFDPERGLEFSTFATPTILGEVKRYFRDKSWTVRIPRRLQEVNQRSRVASERLQQELGRQPSVQELAESIGVSAEEILEAYEASPAQQTVPLDSPLGSGDDPEGQSLADRLGGNDINLERVEAREVLDGALEHLSPREREIMYLRFVEEMPQSEVAKRLGISQMHVSRLQRGAVEHLRNRLGEDAAG